MADKVKELLPNFKKFGRKGKLAMEPYLFQDLGWTVDKDPPDLIHSGTIMQLIKTMKV